MSEIILLSMSKPELKEFICDCVNSCLQAKAPLPPPRPMVDDDRLLTAKEAADFVRLKVRTIYKLAKKKLIPHCKKGKLYYFSKAELQQWAQQGRRITAAEIDKRASEHILSLKSK